MGRTHRIRTLGFVILVCLLGFGSGDLRADEETASGIVRQINAAMKDGRVKRAVALLEGDHAKALLEHPPGAVAALRAVIGGLLSTKSPASRDLNALAAATRSLAAGVAEAVPDSLDQRRAAAYAAAVQARAQLQGAAVTAASLRRGAEPLGALFKEG
ncbi:MAG: hypothetical protein QNJ98_07335, partial [Planctomycetota bacterium]|nr:hypothetical protein [Planctomycetota bacterium]